MDDKQIVELFWERSEDAITQTDIKYGKYESVCTVFLKGFHATSFISNAKIIDEGNANIIFNPPNASVFLTKRQNPLVATAYLKLSNKFSQYALPQIPKLGLYSLKASCNPYIGT